MAIAPAPSSTGKPSAPTSTSKWAYFNGPGVSRPRPVGLSACSPSARKPRVTRQRRHSPFGPHWVSGRPHVAQVPAASDFTFTIPKPMLFPSMRKSQLTPSVFDKDGVAPDRHLQDQKQYWPLPFSTIRGNAGGDAKARCAESRLALQVDPRLPPDSAA